MESIKAQMRSIVIDHAIGLFHEKKSELLHKYANGKIAEEEYLSAIQAIDNMIDYLSQD